MDRGEGMSEAWAELVAVAPPDPVVRVEWRKKTGQIMCRVGRTTRTGRTPSEALSAVVAALRGPDEPPHA